MNPGDGQLEVVPATILPVFKAMRETARVCTDVAWGLTTRTPLMPPAFLNASRQALAAVSVALHRLALDLETSAVEEWWRLARIEAAGGAELTVPLVDFIGDLGSAGRRAWERLGDERGFDLAVDPVGQMAHSAMGAADALGSLWNTAAILLRGTPLYGVAMPGGKQARHELVAMGINLARMSTVWGLLEPEDAGAAALETLGRVVDAPDLASGDLFRWGAHVGTGLALGKGVDAALETEDAGAVEAATGNTYKGLNEANRLPSGHSVKPRTAAGRRIWQVEGEVAKFLENEVP